MGDYMDIKRIKDLREDNDLTQSDIASLLLITRQQYSLYELGKRSFPIDCLDTVADYYNTSVNYLIGEPIRRNPILQLIKTCQKSNYI